MQGRNGAISVIALAERGALFDPGPCMYMEKLAGEPCQAHIYTEEAMRQLPPQIKFAVSAWGSTHCTAAILEPCAIVKLQTLAIINLHHCTGSHASLGCTAVGPEVNPHMVSLLYPVHRNLKAVATALNKPVS